MSADHRHVTFRNPSLQVGRGFLRAPLAAVSLVGAAVLFTAAIWKDPGLDSTLMVAEGMAILAFLLALHIAQHLARSGAWLIPGYSRVHVAVGGVACMLLCLVMAGGLARIHHQPLFPYLAGGLAGTSLGAWMGFHRRLLVITGLVAILMLFKLDDAPGAHAWATAVTPAILVTALSFLGLLLLGWRLLGRREELMQVLPRQLPHAAKDDTDVPFEGTGWSDCGPTARLTTFLSDRYVDLRLAALSSSRWQLVQRWRLPNRRYLGAGFAGGLTLIIALLIRLAGHETIGNSLGPAFLVVGFLLCGLALLSTWHQRRATLGNDLLRPISRRDLFRQIALAMLLDFAIDSLATLLASAILAAVLSPGLYLDARAWLVVSGYLGAATLTLGSALWVARLPAVSCAMLQMTTAYAAMLVVVATVLLHSSCGVAVLLLPVAMAATGFYLAKDAYRRWLVTDLA